MNKIIKKVKKLLNRFRKTLSQSMSLSTSLATILALVLSVSAGLTVVAAPSVVIDTINGQSPPWHCVAGEITITGHGTRGTNGGPYSLDIGWGDGITTTIS